MMTLAAAGTVKELRESYASGRTRPYEWRISQLKQILKLVDENQDEIAESLHQDIGKPHFESFISEVIVVFLQTRKQARLVMESIQRVRGRLLRRNT